MAITKTITLYSYEELSEAAKEAARDWWISGYDNNEVFSDMVEDAKNIGLTIEALHTHKSNKGRFINSARECAEAILKEHGEDCTTFKTAKEYLTSMALFNQMLNACGGEEENDTDAAIEAMETDFLQSLLEDYRVMYGKDCDYRTSEEYIADAMEANGYTFTLDGKRMD